MLNVPPTQTGFRFIGECLEHPHRVTGVFSPVQAMVARDSGAKTPNDLGELIPSTIGGMALL